MRARILEELRKIEETENVRIIMAIESGSRAWGFASPDSDYDVRFIYVRPREDYLKLESVRDVIEWRLDEVLDINGWDINKAIRLLHNSNPTIFEWCNSPIVYMEREEFSWLKELMSEYFSMKKSLYHYWHMAASTYREYLTGDEVRVKKYFYTIRPLLAAKWILSKKCAPPMLFDELVEAELEEELRPELSRLLEMKTNLAEVEMIPRVQVINDYIERTIPEIQAIAAGIEEKVYEWKALDKLFLKMVG